MRTEVINIENVYNTNVYNAIELARENMKMSYETLATSCGLTRMGLYKMLKQKRLTLDTMLKLAAVLNLQPIDLFASAREIEIAHVAEPTAPYGRTISIAAKLQHIKKLTEEIERDLEKM